MTRGYALISGSNTVVAQITDDGSIILGRDKPVNAQLSGSLTLRLGGSQGSNRFLRSGLNGEATFSALSSSLISFNSNIIPNINNNFDLGEEFFKFRTIYSEQQIVGAILETGLTTKGISKFETGALLVWGSTGLEISTKKEDSLVMGIAKNGFDQPIILGAEPVLITGKVKRGDFIVTSNKPGHGMAAKTKYLFFKRNLTGKIIAQALEDADGDSSLIKCMINKN